MVFLGQVFGLFAGFVQILSCIFSLVGGLNQTC